MPPRPKDSLPVCVYDNFEKSGQFSIILSLLLLEIKYGGKWKQSFSLLPHCLAKFGCVDDMLLINAVPSVFTRRQHSLQYRISRRRVLRLSVCLSVSLSVTYRHCVKTTQARITESFFSESSRSITPIAIKDSSRNSKGVTTSDGVKWQCMG